VTEAGDPFARLAARIDPQSTLRRAWPLLGGVSARVTAVELARADGRTQKVVVRQHGAVDLQHNPHIAADEFTLLQRLHAAGLPVPAPVYLAPAGDLFPTPALVVEYIAGAPDFAPAALPEFLRQFATELTRIHQIDGAAQELSFLPRMDATYARRLREPPARLDESLEEGRIRATLAAAWPLPPRNPPVLLHGDYWPGNLLWQAGRVAAILDWEDAQIGDPLADVANSRLELLWAFGSDALRQFTANYRALTTLDFTDLPYWDLCAALRPAGKLAGWGLDAATEQRMRAAHHLFVAQAFAQLAAQSPGPPSSR
jgi:aminoglycoside phosphotransferase (APT) family kinase protein